MQDFRYLEDVLTLEYDPGLCMGCGTCVQVCPHRVFDVGEQKAVLLDPGGCMECGACALNCPAGAIKVRPGGGCAQAILNGWLSRVLFVKRFFRQDVCCS
ncbi:mercury methylation ferredoxin HgcB [Desulfonatronospira sp.]|uniref:mercury methylation ferredoxin HgcB n=1 Tax=Desulfonatronospira sp. TaxID=1962951 RepID=UPI0025C48818|nr:mercury methylation ferredoxin HgcB [Desulfonatronospira sp.]